MSIKQTVGATMLALAALGLLALMVADKRLRDGLSGGDRPQISRGSTTPLPFPMTRSRAPQDEVRPEPPSPGTVRISGEWSSKVEKLVMSALLRELAGAWDLIPIILVGNSAATK